MPVASRQEHPLVENVLDIHRNFLYLEEISRNQDSPDFEDYRKLITLGRNYLPCPISDKLVFAPSKFIGYKENTLDAHIKYKKIRHGGLTDIKLKQIFKSEPEKLEYLNRKFKNFCNDLTFEPKKENLRKFWRPIENLTPEIKGNIIEDNIINDINIKFSDKNNLVKSRVGQGKFRQDVLNLWGRKCCVTNCTHEQLLIASHIKPWSECDSHSERLDKYNGLPLSPSYDRLFDKGLITFGKDGKLLVSKKIENHELELIGCNFRGNVRLYSENLPYLSYHHENVFLN